MARIMANPAGQAGHPLPPCAGARLAVYNAAAQQPRRLYLAMRPPRRHAQPAAGPGPMSRSACACSCSSAGWWWRAGGDRSSSSITASASCCRWRRARRGGDLGGAQHRRQLVAPRVVAPRRPPGLALSLLRHAAARHPAVPDGRAAEPLRHADAGAGHGRRHHPLAARASSGSRRSPSRRHHRPRHRASAAALAARRPRRPPPLYVFGMWTALVLLDRVHRRLHLERRRRGARACAMPSPRRSWRWRASSASRRWAASPRPRRTSSAARSPPSRSSPRSWSATCRADSPYAEDAQLLLSQSERCRTILAELARQRDGEAVRPFRAPAVLGAGRGGGRAAPPLPASS